MATIYHEIHQTKPFRSLEEEVYIALRLTSQLIEQPWARYLRREEGISPSQYNLLRILRGAGEEGLCRSEVGERMVRRVPDVTRLLDRLEAKKLVRRQRCPEDRRQVLCWLTPEGRDLIERLDEPVDAADATAMAMLSHEEQKELIRLLDKVRAGLR